MIRDDKFFNIALLFSFAFHLFLIIGLLVYQNKQKSRILNLDMSLPARSIEVEAVGLPNILKKDLEMKEPAALEEEKDVMRLPSREKILVTKMKILQNLEKNIAKENYMNKVKIIKGLKISAGKEISSKTADKAQADGVSSSGSDAAADQELFKYVDILKSYIKKYWALPNWFYAEGLNAIISMSLTDSGAIKEIKLYKSSGNDYFDNYAIKAIKDAAPFPTPPKTLIDIADNDGLLITFP
jgi:TonB family protein